MAVEDEPDEWLMVQVAKGNRDCLSLLIRRHATPLMTFIQRMVRDRHRSEELFQEIFLAIWVFSQRYRYPRPFKTWLWGIAVKKCRADLRRESFWTRGKIENSALAPSYLVGPAEAAIQCESALLVKSALSQVSAAQRAVLILRIWSGLSYAEIAEVTGNPEVTVRSQMFHGLKKMRKYLEPRMR